MPIGVVLALAMIVRRHFTYAMVAFLLAAALLALGRFALEAQHQPGRAVRDLVATGIGLGLAALAGLSTLLLLDLPMIVRLLTTNYTTLYASYMHPPLAMGAWMVATYGGLTILGAAVGYALVFRARAVIMDAALFVVLFGGLSALAWLFVVRQMSVQFTLHFTPVVVLGLVALVRGLWAKACVRPGALAAVALALIQAVAALAAVPILRTTGLGPLVAHAEPPQASPNYDQVARLVAALHRVTPAGGSVYVASSSVTLNPDLVTSASRVLYGWDGGWLDTDGTAEVDSRDRLSMAALQHASMVVVAEPVQYHLTSGQQNVVRAVVDLFASDQPFSHDFVRLPAQFTFANGATATIYQRLRPTTPATVAETQQFLAEDVRHAR